MHIPSLETLITVDPTVATDIDRLVTSLGDPFIVFFRAGGKTAADVEGLLAAMVEAMLAQMVEGARTGGRYEAMGPADVRDYCATVLARVRRYVLGALQRAEDSK